MSSWLSEELFLNACVPFVHSEMKKRLWKVCYGCKNEGLSQVTHDCLNNYSGVVGSLLPETILFLKSHKVLQEMYRLLKADEERREYGVLSALDILQLLGSEDDDEPLKRISIDHFLQRRLKEKVFADMVVVVQKPEIESELCSLF